MAYLHRYFFCFQPPLAVRRQVGLLRDELDCGVGGVADHRLHMTLGITGDYPRPEPRVAAALITIGEAVDAEPVRISLDRLSGGYGVVALRPSRTPDALRQLQRQLDRRLAAARLRREAWSFNPHVTLVYRAGDPFLRSVPPYEWDATELVLIHSIVGATRHVEMGRWPLKQRQQAWAF